MSDPASKPSFRVFGGLDFSGAKEPLSNLWTAVGVQVNDTLTIVDLRPHAYRQDAVAWISEGFGSILPASLAANPSSLTALWGLDFPLSLPKAAAQSIWPGWDGSWEGQVDRIARELPKDLAAAAEPYNQTKRDCDVGGAMAPLNLRLIRQTHEGMRLIEQLRRDAGLQVLPFDGAPGSEPADAQHLTAIEVYPSQTAKDLGLRGRKPSRPGDGTARPAQLSPHLNFAHPTMAATCGVIEDAWDATLACLTAYLVRNDLQQPTRDPQITEGWIFRHPEAVDR